MTAVNNTVANLSSQLAQGLQALQGMGVNVAGGGGTGAAAGTGATGTNTAANAAVVPGSLTPGILTPDGVTDPVKAQSILGAGGALSLATTSMTSGAAVTVVKDSKGYRLAQGTGRDEIVKVEGRILRFDGSGKNLTNFEVADRESVAVDLDRRQGIASGISNLSRVVAGRQERLKLLSEALAQDANETGSTNQVDIQRLVMEQQVTENLSNMNHKIYESVQNSIQAWLR